MVRPMCRRKGCRETVDPTALVTIGVLVLGCSIAMAGPVEDFSDGARAYRAGDVVTAMPLLQRAADAGEAAAQVMLGDLMERGGYLPEAVVLYRKAAEAGNAEAQFTYAGLMNSGRGVPRDADGARALLRRSAEQGHADAVNALADILIRGGMGAEAATRPTDDDLALIHRSADNGYLPAIDFLARGYRDGLFGSVDRKEAERFQARSDQLRYAGRKPPKNRRP